MAFNDWDAQTMHVIDEARYISDRSRNRLFEDKHRGGQKIYFFSKTYSPLEEHTARLFKEVIKLFCLLLYDD